MTKQASTQDRLDAGLSPTASVTPFRLQDDFDRDVWSVLGVPVDRLTEVEALEAIERAAAGGERLSFVTPNVNFLARATADPDERRRILNADLSLVDGAPLVMLGKLLGMGAVSRCAGSDLFDALRKRPSFAGRRIRVFFFGGRDGAAEAAAAAIERENRGLHCVGWLNPGFGDVEAMSSPAILETINRSGADFLVVALGASKGQAWIDANLDRLDAPVVAHLGAVVDFTAGTIARAPRLVRRIGLEWAWRILAEPSLWRRYFSDGAALALLAATKLGPAAMTRRSEGRPASALVAYEGGNARIALSGDLCADDLAPVRAAYRAAARASGDVILDFSGAHTIDAAFLGLTLMLEKAALRRGGVIMTAGASPAIRRVLKAHSMPYSATGPAIARVAEPGEAGIAAVG